jgi:hypothetical protein
MFFGIPSSVVTDCAVAFGAELLEPPSLGSIVFMLTESVQAVKKRKINAKKNLAICCCIIGCILKILFGIMRYSVLHLTKNIVSFFTA